MSLFTSFKKALGFPDEYDEVEDLDDDLSDLEDKDDVVSTSPDNDQKVASTQERPSGNPMPTIDESVKKITAKIHSIAEIDAENSKAVLDAALEEFAAEINAIAESKAEAEWSELVNSLNKQITKLKDELSVYAKQHQELEVSRLSSTRQKRALGERLAEMERQISSLEAEREQLQMENRYMINKLRGSSMPVVHAAGPLAEELKRLNEETQSQKKELNHVKLQLAAAERQLRLKSDANGVSAEELKEIEDKLLEFEKIKSKKEARIKDLTEKVSNLETENTQLATRLNEELSNSEALSEKVRQLSDTVSKNLQDNAILCNELRAENKRLTEMINASETEKPKRKGREKKDKATKVSPNTYLKVSAIDELMESTDWFAPTPPGPRAKDPDVLQNFGYKETAKKTPKHNDNQLTLF